MKVKIFKNKNDYVFVRENDSIESLPDKIRNLIGNSQSFKSIDLNENDGPRIALDPKAAIKSINSKGYYVQVAEIVK